MPARIIAHPLENLSMETFMAVYTGDPAAYTIVRAESQEAAVKMFLGHPHFTIFPGDGVEIMECLPIPARP
jgi:hypothetical protein